MGDSVHKMLNDIGTAHTAECIRGERKGSEIERLRENLDTQRKLYEESVEREEKLMERDAKLIKRSEDQENEIQHLIADPTHGGLEADQAAYLERIKMLMLDKQVLVKTAAALGERIETLRSALIDETARKDEIGKDRDYLTRRIGELDEEIKKLERQDGEYIDHQKAALEKIASYDRQPDSVGTALLDSMQESTDMRDIARRALGGRK